MYCRLHHTAGSQNVIELHGRNDRVVCCECGCNLSRKVVQQQIESINSKFLDRIKSLKLHELSRVEREGIIRADGDTELGISDFSEVIIFDIPISHLSFVTHHSLTHHPSFITYRLSLIIYRL